MLLELKRYTQLLRQTLALLFSILLSLDRSYTNQCKGNGLQVQRRHPQSSSGWDAVQLPPSPQPASNLVVSQEVLLGYESFRALPICLYSLQAANETGKLVLLDLGMQLHSCVKWGGLMLIFETGKTTITGLNSKKLLWFVIYERKNSISHLPLTSGILSLLFFTVCERLKSLSMLLKIILLL